MMKLLSFLFLFSAALSAQEALIESILKDVNRDSSDKVCKSIFDNLYESFESDEGLVNKKMGLATSDLIDYKMGIKSINRQLALLLDGYMNSLSDPTKALKWIAAMKQEYANIYHTSHPLILLYEGESMINGKRAADAYKHFDGFLKLYPNSVMAWIYLYRMEPDKRMAKTWLSILKSQHPNHWIVKELQ